jgi:hypothetical protein
MLYVIQIFYYYTCSSLVYMIITSSFTLQFLSTELNWIWSELGTFQIFIHLIFCWDTWQHGWMKHCATSQKVAGLIPDEVIGFFNWPNPSSRTLALELTQSLTEISTGNLPGGKGRPACEADNLNAICELIV